MTYILWVTILSLNAGSGVSQYAAEFDTGPACLRAADMLATDYRNIKLPPVKVVISCLPKSAPGGIDRPPGSR